MKYLVFAALLVASFSAKSQSIQHFGLEKASVVVEQQKNMGEQMPVAATLDTNKYEPLPFGNVKIIVTSDIPLSLRVVEESYTGKITPSVYPPSKRHEVKILATENYRIVVMPFK